MIFKTNLVVITAAHEKVKPGRREQTDEFTGNLRNVCFCLKRDETPKGKERERRSAEKGKKVKQSVNEIYICAEESSVSVLFYNELC